MATSDVERAEAFVGPEDLKVEDVDIEAPGAFEVIDVEGGFLEVGESGHLGLMVGRDAVGWRARVRWVSASGWGRAWVRC